MLGPGPGRASPFSPGRTGTGPGRHPPGIAAPFGPAGILPFGLGRHCSGPGICRAALRRVFNFGAAFRGSGAGFPGPGRATGVGQASRRAGAWGLGHTGARADSGGPGDYGVAVGGRAWLGLAGRPAIIDITSRDRATWHPGSRYSGHREFRSFAGTGAPGLRLRLGIRRFAITGQATFCFRAYSGLAPAPFRARSGLPAAAIFRPFRAFPGCHSVVSVCYIGIHFATLHRRFKFIHFRRLFFPSHPSPGWARASTGPGRAGRPFAIFRTIRLHSGLFRLGRFRPGSGHSFFFFRRLPAGIGCALIFFRPARFARWLPPFARFGHAACSRGTGRLGRTVGHRPGHHISTSGIGAWACHRAWDSGRRHRPTFVSRTSIAPSGHPAIAATRRPGLPGISGHCQAAGFRRLLRSGAFAPAPAFQQAPLH